MPKRKNILELSKQKPNLSVGVNVSKIEKIKKKKNHEVKPRIPIKKKIESVRDYDGSRVSFTKDIYNIWKNNKNFDSFEKTPKKRSGKLSSFLIFISIFAAIFIYIVYWNNTRDVKGEGVVLEIRGDDEFVSGKEVKFTIKYQNKQNIKIKNLELRINYPKDFYYISSEPSASTLSMNVWKLEDLRAGGSAKIELVGQIIGNIGDEISLDAVLSYEQANFSSVLEAKISKNLKIESSMVDFLFEGPDEVSGNDRVTYQMKYKNISDSEINNFRIKLEYPENFIPIETNINTESEFKNIWIIDNLKKGEEGLVSVTGLFDAEVTTSSTLKALLEIRSLAYDESNVFSQGQNLNWYKYKEISKEIKMKKMSANLKLSINNQITDSTLNWEDELNYQISYKNTSETPLENVVIKAFLDSNYFDLETIEDNYKGIVDENKQIIIWDKESIASLAKINTEQEGRINFKIKLLPFKDSFISKNNYFATSSIVLSYGNTSNEQSKNQIESNMIVDKINSFVDFSVSSRYYDDSGNAVGSGPIPPIVGESTSYEILWKAISKTSNLIDVDVKTNLPENVDWGGGFADSGQEISFNESTRQVIWHIDNLEKNKEITVRFVVTVNPEKKDEGKFMTLNNAILFSATDEYSNGRINLSKDSLTTECIGDKKASGKGKVIDL